MAIADKQGNTEIFRSDVTDTITDTSYIIPTWDMTLTSKVTVPSHSTHVAVISISHDHPLFQFLWYNIPYPPAHSLCLIYHISHLVFTGNRRLYAAQSGAWTSLSIPGTTGGYKNPPLPCPLPYLTSFTSSTSIWLVIMQVPSFPIKLLIPILHIGLFLVPFTSQFFLPALPVTTYLISFYSSQFIPNNRRPGIYVSLLPTFESVRSPHSVHHPILDAISWIPYGIPFVVTVFL